jgi:hypothetical protein
LEEVGVNENNLLWVNADQDLDQIPHPTRRHFLALGEVAQLRLEELVFPVMRFDHPQYHKRFRYREPYPLAKFLEGRFKP